MKDNTKWIAGTIVISIIVIGFFSFFTALAISNIKITHSIKMDDNTREYLIEHDYCIQMQSSPYFLNESDNVFIGDCEYLDVSLFQQE